MFGIKKARKGLYSEFFILVLPIVIQNLISAAVSSADVIMLGLVGKTELSASSLAGQMQFILLIVFFGVGSGFTILASQYWGKRDTETISRIMGMGFVISGTIALFFFVIAFFFSEGAMRIWVGKDEALVRFGAQYLKAVSFSYLFMSVSHVYLSIIKSCERVTFASAVSVITLSINIILNGILIFGLFGFPKLGIVGAALATTIARGVEVLLCLYDAGKQRLLPVGLSTVFGFRKVLIMDFVKYSLPAIINDVMWVLAYSFYSVVMGHIGSDMVAANSVVGVAMTLVTTVGFGISAGSSILLGKELGQNKVEQAKRDADSILLLTIGISIVAGLIMVALHPVIMYLARGMNDVTETALGYLNVMIYINAVYQLGQVVNTLLIASLFRAGGDTKFGMIIDIITMWCFAVPVGFTAAFILDLPPMVVYLLMRLDEFVKMPAEFIHYKNGKWLRDITRTVVEE